MTQEDETIENLLYLDGEIFADIEPHRGLWVKFEAKRVKITAMRPQGIKYSLSLHDRNGKRIMGIDNAHPIKYKAKSQEKPKIVCDHWHKKGSSKPVPYEFKNAEKLMNDFWANVNEIISES
jgi:hypothetical protein